MHNNTRNYLTFTFVKLNFLEIELFDHLTLSIYKMCLQIILYIFVKTGFGIKQPTMVDMP